ncbi:hypothetical protein MRB53_021265 [Persea americana]|uniref:Uncharacterized protein n=1 Tax=Persea americana TaxID=3435 RepID=A0ACC2L4K1_PERAE|nr:hypothetical protein MRB53_021265 [Persea americana]
MFPLGNGEPELPVAILPTGAHLTPIGQQNQVVAPAIDIDHTLAHHDDVASTQNKANPQQHYIEWMYGIKVIVYLHAAQGS